MPRSAMTGFGQADENGYHIEIKGVNHRYRDIRVKLPKDLSALEIPVRDLVAEHVTRGKVELTVTKLATSDVQERLSINWELARAYHQDLVQMVQLFGGEVNFRDILALPGIMEESMGDAEEHAAGPDGGRQEGPQRVHRIEARRGQAAQGGHVLPAGLPHHPAGEDERRGKGNGGVLPGQALEPPERAPGKQGRQGGRGTHRKGEVAIIADRSDITEELVRLLSHITSFKDVIADPDPSIGRRLDFILQEINRELNTIGSKSPLTSLSRTVIEGKAEGGKNTRTGSKHRVNGI